MNDHYQDADCFEGHREVLFEGHREVLNALVGRMVQREPFVLIERQSHRAVFSEVIRLAHEFGRSADICVLDLAEMIGAKDVHFKAILATGDTTAINELRCALLDETGEARGGEFSRERARALIRAIVPILIWLRDEQKVSLSLNLVRLSIELPWISKLVMEGSVRLRTSDTEEATELDVKNTMPAGLLAPLRLYLADLPGFDPRFPPVEEWIDEIYRQHSYGQHLLFVPLNEMIAGRRNLLRFESGEIDIRNIVHKQQILLVKCPTPETVATSDRRAAIIRRNILATSHFMLTEFFEQFSLEAANADALSYEFLSLGVQHYPIAVLERMASECRRVNISVGVVCH